MARLEAHAGECLGGKEECSPVGAMTAPPPTTASAPAVSHSLDYFTTSQ